MVSVSPGFDYGHSLTTFEPCGVAPLPACELLDTGRAPSEDMKQSSGRSKPDSWAQSPLLGHAPDLFTVLLYFLTTGVAVFDTRLQSAMWWLPRGRNGRA